MSVSPDPGQPSEGLTIPDSWQEQSRRPQGLAGPWQVPFPSLPPVPELAGSLQKYLSNWERLTQDQWVLEAVQGFRIPFKRIPHQSRIPVVRMSKEEEGCVSEEVSSLIDKGAIVEVLGQERGSFYSTLFTVPKKGGGRRPIINLKPLNKGIPHFHFKMEGVQSLKDIVLRGDFMIKLDLKDAYFAVPIHSFHQKYLSFIWEGKHYQFTCLPFGLSCAPRTFTKVMKPLVAYLRSLGVRLVIYIDDMLILDQSKEQLLKWRSIALDLLESMGFLVNYKKSVLGPSQSIVFLGFLLNTVTMELKLPPEKISQATREAQNLLKVGSATARQLAHLIGLFTFTLPAILPAPLHYRGLQELKHAILRRGGYSASLPLSGEAIEDLEWWIQKLPQVNGRGLVRDNPSLEIRSDASLSGWGAVCQGKKIGGPWLKAERSLHINCLELLAATYAVQALAKDNQNLVIQLLVDNSTTVAYINHMGGTKSPQLCHLARTLWDWCLQRGILLAAKHIPGVQNVQADRLSRSIVDRHDWQLNPAIFRKIDSLWGPLQVDLFASRASKQTSRFFSWKPDPEAEAVDAFAQNWADLKGFANPPWSLVGRCLQQVLQQRATIVLVTPLWPTQVWFPALFPLLLDYPRMLPEFPDLIINLHQEHRVPLPEGASRLVAWFISGDHTKGQEFRKMLQPSSCRLGGVQPIKTTTPLGNCGSVGVLNITPTQFLPL